MKTVLSSIASEDLGRRIREVRGERGWSLAEVSRRTGLSRAYINALERGKGRRPGAETIRRLEDVLGRVSTGGPVGLEELPIGLQQLAVERNLPTSEIQVLAGLQVRGRQPESLERWRFIYDALVASESIDGRAENAGS